MNQQGLFNSKIDLSPVPPQKPVFQEFNLTKETYEQIKHKIEVQKRWIKFAKKKMESAKNIYGVIFEIIAVIIIIYLNPNIWTIQIIPVVWVTFIISGIVFYLIVEKINLNKWVIKKSKNIKNVPSDSELENYRNFEETIKQYLQKYDKYLWELSEYNRTIEAQNKEYWFSLDGWTFESEFAKLLDRQGFETEITSGSSDGGVDIFALKDGVKIAIQCKAHKNAIGPSVIRDLYGSMIHNNIKNGVLVNLGGLTKGVIEFAKDKSIILLDILDVIKLSKGEKYLSISNESVFLSDLKD